MQSAAVGRDGLAVADALVVADERADRDACTVSDVRADSDLRARADRGAGSDVRLGGDVGVGPDDRIGLDPRTAAHVDVRGDSDSRFDVRTRLDDRGGVHFGPVRDQAPTVGVLAVAKRLAVVVLDVDVVLTHSPLL